MRNFLARFNFGKIKSMMIILVFLCLFFFLTLIFIDFKKSSQKDTISVIGVAKEKVLKDAQFSLEYTFYGTSEDDVKKKLDDKITEIKNLVGDFDQIVVSDIEKNLMTDCIVNTKFYYHKGLEEGKCLSNNWRGKAIIRFSVKGDKYTDDIRKKIINLAPNVVNSASGPIFLKKNLDKDYESILIEKAMTNAKQKAEKMAKESDREIKKITGVDENPLVKNSLMSVQSDDKELLNPGEDILEKQILVNFELD